MGVEMRKIKDRIILGIVSGLIAGIPGKFINAFEHRKGLTDMRYNRISVTLFTKSNKVNSKEAKTLAAIANNVNSGIFGVLTSYLLSFTGRDYAVIKGAGVAAFAWVIVNGLIGSQMLKQTSKNPVPPVLSFLDHLINGGLCGIIVSKLGDDSIFPDTKSLKRDEKLPTIAMNNEESKPSLEHPQNYL